MTRSIAFTIPGKPVPKARARVVRTRSGRTVAFTPASTKRYERLVWVTAYNHSPSDWPKDARYSLTLKVYGARANADLDNIAKSVCDGAEGVLWANDKHVTRVDIERCTGGEPRTEVTVEVVE